MSNTIFFDLAGNPGTTKKAVFDGWCSNDCHILDHYHYCECGTETFLVNLHKDCGSGTLKTECIMMYQGRIAKAQL